MESTKVAEMEGTVDDFAALAEKVRRFVEMLGIEPNEIEVIVRVNKDLVFEWQEAR